jgi:recombination protein U
MGKRFPRRAKGGDGQQTYTGNRGMSFEYDIEHTNWMYEHMGLAAVNKRPTPVRIQNKTVGGVVTGFLEKPSTVDFEGLLRGGRSIVFEAKQVRSKERFNLSDISEHQVEHLRKCHELGGISFVLIEFPEHRTVYLLHYKTLEGYWQRWKNGGGARGTASIHRDDLEVHGYVVDAGRVPVDYLEVVRKVWKLGDDVIEMHEIMRLRGLFNELGQLNLHEVTPAAVLKILEKEKQ